MKRLKWSALIALAVSFLTVMVPAVVLEVKHGDGSFEAFSSLGYAVLQQHVPAAPDLSPVQTTWTLLGSAFTLALLTGLLRLYKLPWWLLQFVWGTVAMFFAAPAGMGWAGAQVLLGVPKPPDDPKWKFGMHHAGYFAGIMAALVATMGAIVMLVAALIKHTSPETPLGHSWLNEIPIWLHGTWAGFFMLSWIIGYVSGTVQSKKRMAAEAAKEASVPATDAELEALGLNTEPAPEPPREETLTDFMREYLKKPSEKWASQRYDAEHALIMDLTGEFPRYTSREELERVLELCEDNGWTNAKKIVQNRLSWL